jgi:protein-disulfide isomerase
MGELILLIVNLKERFTALPVQAKRLLGIGVVLALAVALPLFIWAVVTQRFLISKKAQETPRVNINITGAPSIGPSNAPVTVVEFGDFQCEFCKAFHDNTLQQLLSAYPTQIKFVWKNFPLTPLHPLAETMSEAAMCANDQGFFWQMSDLLFANQDATDSAALKALAHQNLTGLNTATFDLCLDSASHSAEIQQDKTDGTNAGVTGTPTFFINGLKVVGNQPLSALQAIIDQELLPSPSPTESPTASPSINDDVFFKSQGNSVVFTTTDENPNVSVAPENLVAGKTYVLQIIYSLQNNQKSQEASSSGIPVIVLVDNVFKSAKDIPYSLIANHTDGASDTQSASFTAQGNTTTISVVFDPNNIFPETNESNNTLTFNFSRSSATPTPTATPSPEPTFVPGEPNSCGGTCGSHYNCAANYFCYEGFCRRPECRERTDCNCAGTPTPTSKSKFRVRATATPAVVYLTANPKSTPKGTITPKPTATASPTATPGIIKTSPNLSFLLYIAAAAGAGAIILLLIGRMTRPK